MSREETHQDMMYQRANTRYVVMVARIVMVVGTVITCASCIPNDMQPKVYEYTIRHDKEIGTQELHITTEPSGARIFVDGEFVGTSPTRIVAQYDRLYKVYRTETYRKTEAFHHVLSSSSAAREVSGEKRRFVKDLKRVIKIVCELSGYEMYVKEVSIPTAAHEYRFRL